MLPDHLPAVLARADLLAQGKHWNRLIDFIEEAMPRLADKPPETRAELLRRKAVGFEGLEASDEAYETLIEADKLHRGNLLVKLALGNNRYHARRWREAALHLSALAEHPMAEVYPTEVAEGLYHAALAEIRSMRPEKAEALYERAVALKPNYAPPLHALAEMAMEKGDSHRAADLLTRQAAATEDPAERVRLFEALGDMALMTLSDEARAVQCYQAAVNAAVPLESRHVPLLEKLLERQDLAGDHAGAARTAELMASFAAEPEARAARLKAAAENYLAAGERARARTAAERALIADPYDLDVITIASELTMADGDHEATAAMLGRALQAREVVELQAGEVTAPRLSLLWSRLGDARQQRGDRKGAVAAFQQAIQLALESDGAMHARRALLALWRDEAERRDDVIELHRVLAADTLDAADVYGYAQALCRAGNADGGRALLELVAAMGQPLSNDDVKFLAVHPARVMAEDDPYRGTVDGDARAELIADDDDQPMAAVLTTLWEAAPLLWADVVEAQARMGMSGAHKVPAASDLPAATIYTRIARALDAPATVLYVTEQSDAPDVTVLCVAPPAVVLGPRLHGHGDAVSDLELRFQLARAAELARPERIAAVGLPPDHLAALCASLVRLFGRGRHRVRHLARGGRVPAQEPAGQGAHAAGEAARLMPVRATSTWSATARPACARPTAPACLYAATSTPRCAWAACPARAARARCATCTRWPCAAATWARGSGWASGRPSRDWTAKARRTRKTKRSTLRAPRVFAARHRRCNVRRDVSGARQGHGRGGAHRRRHGGDEAPPGPAARRSDGRHRRSTSCRQRGPGRARGPRLPGRLARGRAGLRSVLRACQRRHRRHRGPGVRARAAGEGVALMRLCRVLGNVVATVKHPVYIGHKLLIVQQVDGEGRDVGSSFLAVDTVQAGPGDQVLVMSEGNGVRQNLAA